MKRSLRSLQRTLRNSGTSALVTWASKTPPLHAHSSTAFPKSPINTCEVCAKGKASRHPFPISSSHASDLLELVHSDLIRPFPVSLGRAKYAATFVDDKSRYIWVFLAENKSDTFQIFKTFVTRVENETGRQIKILRTDNGGEYTGNEFRQFVQDRGIHHELTIPDTPQQNGRAEQSNCTLVERVRCMLNDVNLPARYWGEAMLTAVYLLSLSPHSAVVGKVLAH